MEGSGFARPIKERLVVMKPFSGIFLFLLVTAGAQAQARTEAATGALQNAVTISFNAAVLQTNEAQRSLGDLEKKLAPREAHIKALNEEVDGLKKQMSTTGDKLADAERTTRLQAIDSKQKQLQREMEDYKNDSQTEAQQAFQAVAQKVYTFLQEYAQKNGYRFVLERGAAENPVVWYAAENTDITAAVVQAYNAKSGIAAPATKPAAPERKNN
jgi:outer membrane protein